MNHDVVAIIASAGGTAGVRRILSDLPGGFPVPLLCIAANMGVPELESFDRALRLDVQWALHAQLLGPGIAYFAPPGGAMVVRADLALAIVPFTAMSLPPRPADDLLESLAAVHGARALALLLSAEPGDAVEGARAFKGAGGTLLSQACDPAAPDPVLRSVAADGLADQVLAIGDMALALKIALTARALVEPAALRCAVEDFLDEAMAAQGAARGTIHLREPHGVGLQLLAERGCAAAYLDHFRFVMPSGGSACARALRHGRRVVIEDVEADADFKPHRAVSVASGVRSVHATPIVDRDGHVLGMLSTLFPEARRLEPAEARRLDASARKAAEALQRLL